MRIKTYYFICLFTCFVSTNLLAQDQLNITSNDWEPGKCYAFRLLDQKDNIPVAEERYFKVTAPTWKIEQDTIKSVGGEKQRVLTQEAYYTYVLKHYGSHAVSAAKGSYMVICAIEIPARYTTLQIDEDSLKVIEVNRLLKNSEVIQLKSKDFLDLPFDEGESFGALTQGKYLRYFKLKKGNWSETREVISGGCGGSSYLVKKIQQKLKDLGYDVDINDIMDAKTKAALTLFQKKNELPVGQLDIETMKMLNVNWH